MECGNSIGVEFKLKIINHPFQDWIQLQKNKYMS